MRTAKMKVTITFSFTVRTREHAPILCSMYILSNETELCPLVAIVQHQKGLLTNASHMQYKGRSAAIAQHQSQELLAENWPQPHTEVVRISRQ